MKYIKRILCLVMAIVLCCSLTACNELDEMRAAHAFYQVDGTILWNGYTYYQLTGDYSNLNLNYSNYVYVTEKNVPLLVSRTEGHLHYASDNGLLLEGSNYMETTVFCREDYYDQTQNAILNGFEIEKYGYTEWVETDFDFVEKQFYLTAYERETIDRILSSSPVDGYEQSQWSYSLSIYGYSEDDIFSMHVCDVMYDGESYILRLDDDTDVYYPVPESDWETIDTLSGRSEGRILPSVIEVETSEITEGEEVATTVTSIQ